MNITKIITGIIITFMFFALWAANASQTRNIDPRCGFADGSEQCHGYLYAKYNQLKALINAMMIKAIQRCRLIRCSYKAVRAFLRKPSSEGLGFTVLRQSNQHHTFVHF